MDAQRRYDIAYQQCMYAKGNQLPGAYGYGSYRPASPYGTPPPAYPSGQPGYSTPRYEVDFAPFPRFAILTAELPICSLSDS